MKTDILEIVEDISVEIDGKFTIDINAVTVSYWGKVDGYDAITIIEEMVDKLYICTVDKTVAARFLSSNDFK